MQLPVLQQIVAMLDGQVSSAIEQSKDRQLLLSLPPAFIEFLKSRSIDVEELCISIPRFIRAKPPFAPSLSEMAEQLNIPKAHLVRVDEQFWALAPHIKINHTQLYRQAKIYGIDYSSSIPVTCLDVKENNRVIELCSAPGNKSMYIADTVPCVQIVAVEISENRANIMKSLVKKYGLSQSIQVVIMDALKFELQDQAQHNRFDRVLIDAECTHEGSIKHIQKFISKVGQRVRNSHQIDKQCHETGHTSKHSKNKVKRKKQLTLQQQKQFERNNSNPYTSEIKQMNNWTQQDFQERFLDPLKLQNLKHLQRGLLAKGFSLLKQGGILVYSTCSLDRGQNQDIISWFLQNQQTAHLMDARDGLNCALPYANGGLEGTIHFRPSVSRCGGMFVCKLTKKLEKA